MKTIAEALSMLDSSVDDQWTSDGLPKMDVVRELTGDPELTRKQVTETAPQFTRETAAPAEEPTAEEPQEDPRAAFDQEISELTGKRDELNRRIDELQRKRNAAQQAVFDSNDHKADTKARIAYIKKQNEIRAARARRRIDFIKAGVRPEDLDPRSKIDQAFTRRTGRGASRPERPLKKTNQE